MTMTDPIADMLTRMRNANTAMKDTVTMPASKLKLSLADILTKEGYLGGFEVKDRPGATGETLEIQMKYSTDRQRVIAGLKRVSKPGLRVYMKVDDMPRVLGGMGIAVLSTNQGLMTDRDARKRGVGGEVLCYVW